MHRKVLFIALFTMAAGSLTTAARAQEEASQEPPSAQETIVGFIENVKAKLVTLAEDGPEEIYTYRPAEEVRTFGEILMHVARSNDLIASRIEGRPPRSVMDFQFVNKAETLEKLEGSFATVLKAIEKNPDPAGIGGWVYAATHGSEHYGNLVTYYRLNGLVPPASR